MKSHCVNIQCHVFVLLFRWIKHGKCKLWMKKYKKKMHFENIMNIENGKCIHEIGLFSTHFIDEQDTGTSLQCIWKRFFFVVVVRLIWLFCLLRCNVVFRFYCYLAVCLSISMNFVSIWSNISIPMDLACCGQFPSTHKTKTGIKINVNKETKMSYFHFWRLSASNMRSIRQIWTFFCVSRKFYWQIPPLV